VCVPAPPGVFLPVLYFDSVNIILVLLIPTACEERRARPFPSRVAGHAQRSSRYGASREGMRPPSWGGGRRMSAADACRPACVRFRESEGRFRRVRELPRSSARQSDAFGSAGEEGARRGGGGRPFGRARGPCAGDRAWTGSAHPLRSTHPPTRVREWISYEADRGSGGSCWIRRRSRATSCRKRANGVCG